MRRSVVAGVAVVLAAGVAIPALAAGRDNGPKNPGGHGDEWAVCIEHPTLHITPPLSLDTAHAASLNASDVLENCTSSDRSIERGIAYITATSPSASCQSGTSNGIARIRWNNGRTSKVEFSASFAAGFAHTTSGHATDGNEFVGESFAALDHLNVDAVALQLCSTPSLGLSNLASDGVIAIGDPPTTDGVIWRP
jgi:hypothetical protein